MSHFTSGFYGDIFRNIHIQLFKERIYCRIRLGVTSPVEIQVMILADEIIQLVPYLRGRPGIGAYARAQSA